MKNEVQDTVQIIPLGGFDKIGMNMLAIQYQESTILIDCGMSFPEDNLPGIDTSVPDIKSFLKYNAHINGIVLTHGHEDHIGALPYILPDLNLPVYGTPLTIGLVEKKLAAYGIKKTRTKAIKIGHMITLGEIRVEFLRANHSIPDAAMLAIYTPAGVIIHTGDFKIDYTPLYGESTNLQRLSILGYKKVLALISDSTNALRPGTTPSELNVAETLDRIFYTNKEKRMIIVTFSSNVDRVHQIINLAQKHHRKVVLQGQNMLDVLDVARSLGYMSFASDLFITKENMASCNKNEIVFITTGSQGEPMAELSQMAYGEYPWLNVCKDDLIIFSSIPVPGNEKSVARTISLLERQGATIIQQDMHVSGHACIEELKLIYSLVHPQYAIPAHGDFRHRSAGAKIAKKMGIPSENIFMIDNGDVLSISESNPGKIIDHIDFNEIFVDGRVVGDVGDTILTERHALADSGVVIIQISLERRSGRILYGPEIITKGLLYEVQSESVIRGIRDTAMRTLTGLSQKPTVSEIKNVLKTAVSEYISHTLGRNPIIIALVDYISI